MQTIRITITSEKPANIVLTERKPEEDKVKNKRSPNKKLETLLSLMPKETTLAGAIKGDEKLCN